MGLGTTYSLMTDFLAPGYQPLELPDCSHQSFGDHIDEVFDNTLDKYVFRFHIPSTSEPWHPSLENHTRFVGDSTD